MSGQTLTDRIAAAQYHVVGSAVSRSVCKASTHELMAPKKKHLDFLIQCTNETNVNIPQLADTLFERAMNSSWIVVFKALVATDHLMCNGNERFIQYLASRNTLFNLSNFLDKSGVQGYDMSTFVRRYSKYLNEKAYSYRQMAFDFTRVKRGNEGLMRSMNVEKLLKALPVLQGQVDALLDFDASPSDLSNGVINAAFSLLFKDMIRLFACYNDGVINLLEKFFELKKTQSKDALELYKKFLTRMTRVAEFFKIAEQIGIDKGDIPDIAQVLSTQVLHDLKLHGEKESPFKELTFETAPSSLLEAMEQHVAIQEAKKGKEGSTGRVASGGTGAAAPTTSSSPVSTPAQSIDTTAGGDVFLASSAPQVTSASNDLLGLQTDFLSAAEPLVQPASPSMGSWADMFGSLPEPTRAGSPKPEGPTNVDFLAPDVFTSPPCGASPMSDAPASSDLLAEAFIGTPSSTTSPAKSESFASPAPAIDLLGDAFGSPTQGAVPICATSPAPDPFAALTLQPTSDPKSGCSSQQLDFDMFGAQAAPIAPTTILPAAATAPSQEASGFDLIGDMLLPSMQQQQPQMQPQVLGHAQQATGKLVANDLDSSLANLVGNLGISSPAKKGQWSGGEKKLTGGANWQPRAAPPAWAPAPAAPAPAMQNGWPFPHYAPGAMAGVPLMGPAPAMFGATSAQTGMRPPFGSMGTAQLSPSPTPVSQSPQKGPTKDPLADLNLKDFI
ncbi:clathrin coat assembly protein AP180-like isoform X11 [Lampetra planeri]